MSIVQYKFILSTYELHKQFKEFILFITWYFFFSW
jgi:hypothetical protein